jgi:hypothetical protein
MEAAERFCPVRSTVSDMDDLYSTNSVKINQNAIKLLLVMSPCNMSCILDFHKPRFWKAVANIPFAYSSPKFSLNIEMKSNRLNTWLFSSYIKNATTLI